MACWCPGTKKKVINISIVTDNHLEPPLEKVNKEVVFRNPTVRTLLNKSTLRTLPHLEPSLTIIYNIYIYMYIYIYICNLETQINIYIYICTILGAWGTRKTYAGA